METIQVVLDSKLRQAADRAAKRKKVNRSALLRDALREYLKRERIREMEERDRRAYEAHPQTDEEIALWEDETAWLEE
jgi:metal-responsive CopG/Arc/MetJ family transcriptional regulator